MTMLGMDVELVSHVATQLDGQASTVDAAVAGIDRLVEDAVAQWFGQDAQQFTQEWQSRHRPALVAAVQSIAQLATTARRNVGEQEQASGVAGAPPVSAGGRTADGRLDVQERAASVGAGPTGVAGLLGLVRGAYTQPGGVSVTFTGSGADRHAIVAVSGTEEWNVGGTNPDDMTTNLGNAFGAQTLKQEAISQAMVDAGVQPTDKVLLVGHSQGGADVIAFASHAANTSAYDITGVVTAGAPETVEYPASNIPVLELRTDGDVVPALGASSAAGLAVGGLPGAAIGAAVHDATLPGNVTISELPGGWELPWNAHAITTYIGDSAHITDPAVTNFVAAHQDFLTGAPSATYTYSAQRVGGSHP